jgi:ABC-type lipoprotein release transport system permease subunit
MSTFRLIIQEIGFRRTNFLLMVLAITVAVAFWITFESTGQAIENETRINTRNMGHNLRIIAGDTDLIQFYNNGFSDMTMPESHLDGLAAQGKITYNHLMATLQQRLTWRGKDVVLTGLAPQVYPPGRPKPPMSVDIDPGTVYLGHYLATQLNLKKGDRIDVDGKTFTVANCLSEQGNVDDIRIQCHLADAQAILNLPGRINEIQAIDCLCLADAEDPLAVLRENINSVLPGVQVVQLKNIAEARTQQRVMVFKYVRWILPLVIVAAGLWIAILAMINVRDRRQEIGIMRALGYGSGKIAVLFLGKSILAGILGALLGFALGTFLSIQVGPAIFTVAVKFIKPLYDLLGWSVLAAPLFAALAGFIPAMLAVAQEPATTLRES